MQSRIVRIFCLIINKTIVKMEFPYLGLILFISIFINDLAVVSSIRCPRLTLPNGRVRIRSRGRTVQFRCLRGFTRVGPKMAICLKSNQWSQKTPLCVGVGCPKLQLPPTLNATELHQGSMLHFTCTSGYTRQGPAQIYCVGKEWNKKPPTCTKGMSLGCDFETEGLCGWSQDVEADKMDWIRHKGSTATKDTGPSVDNTLGTPEGHYLFIETSAPSKRGDSAKLISPSYTPKDILGVCMDFFYHMFGSDKRYGVGSLEVFLKPNNVPLSQLANHDKVMSLFEMDGNQGDEWHRQEIELPLMEESFQFIFEARKQNSWLSDIALDDIRLYNCTNNTTTIITSPTERTDTIPTTTTTPANPKSMTTKRQTTTTLPVTSTRTTSTTPRPTTARRRTTTTTPLPTTRRRTTTTTPQPTTRRRTTTTTPLPTTRRRTTTTTPLPTTRRRTTTTTPLPTTRRRTTTTTPLPTTTRRRTTTTTSRPTTTYRRTTKHTTIWMRRKSTHQPIVVSTTTMMPKLPGVSTTTSAKSPLSSPAFHPVHESTSQQPKSPSPPPKTWTTPNPPKKTSTKMNSENIKTTAKTNYAESDKTESSRFDNESATNKTFNTNVGVGKSQDRPNSSISSSQKLIPLIAGVAAAVVLVAVVVAILAFKWSKKQRVKEEKEMDDQMNIISDYVETSLGRE